ncbi:rhomboid family intramembrane serine protease [Sphingobacterium sp. SG20118]|uniref:rhomboid family intramembrane serine protease n=1 Tax=Sphingobacterium sp. SG20118 TaxID=3367156 RepID=UPI0037DFC51C
MQFFDVFPTFQEAPYSYIIVPILMISGILGFYTKPYFHAVLLHPYELARGKRLHTLLTSAFIHRNWIHLLFNMLIIYGLGYDMFGNIMQVYGSVSAYLLTPLLFSLLIIIPNAFLVLNKRNDFYFTSIGASGLTFGLYGFSALFFPLQKINHLFIPWIHNAAQYWLYILIVLTLLSCVKISKINRSLHIVAYLLGSIIALITRNESIYEFTKALFLKF